MFKHAKKKMKVSVLVSVVCNQCGRSDRIHEDSEYAEIKADSNDFGRFQAHLCWKCWEALAASFALPPDSPIRHFTHGKGIILDD